MLDKNNFRIILDIPFAPTAGEAMTLSCIVVPPDRFVLSLSSIMWSYDAIGSQRVHSINPDAILGPLVNESNGSFSRNIMLNPVKTSDARRYFCSYTVGIINDASSTNFTINSKYTCIMYILHISITFYSSIT